MVSQKNSLIVQRIESSTIELAHLTESQRKAYIIADNKLALNAGWDIDLLSLEMKALGEEGEIDLLDFFSELTIYTSTACLIGKEFPAISMIFVADLLASKSVIEIETTAIIPVT